jgi:hypothetical protein
MAAAAPEERPVSLSGAACYRLPDVVRAALVEFLLMTLFVCLDCCACILFSCFLVVLGLVAVVVRSCPAQCLSRALCAATPAQISGSGRAVRLHSFAASMAATLLRNRFPGHSKSSLKLGQHVVTESHATSCVISLHLLTSFISN